MSQKATPNSGIRSWEETEKRPNAHPWKGRRRLFQRGRMIVVLPRRDREFLPIATCTIMLWAGPGQRGKWIRGGDLMYPGRFMSLIAERGGSLLLGAKVGNGRWAGGRERMLGGYG